jgi:hypothetical protein
MLLTTSSTISWSIFIGLVVVILASVAAWFFSPKGETQAYAPLRLHVHTYSYDRIKLDVLTNCA